jgi:hypothetical protein
MPSKDTRSSATSPPQNDSKPVYIEIELHKRLTRVARKRGLSASALAEIFIGMRVYGEELKISREREAYLLLEAIFEKLIKESR